MAKYHFAHIFMLAIAALAFTACTPDSAPATSTTKTTTRIPLWKVTSAQRTVYVTGAMGIPLKTRPVPKRTAQAFAQSGTLVTEGEIGPEAKAKVKALLKEYGPIPGGRTLADELTDTQLGRVKTVLAALGVDYKDVQHDQPWAAVMHFAHAAVKKSGRKPHPRYRHFKHLAKQRHMSVDHLDTSQQEIEMLANMPVKQQVAFLMQPVNEVVLHPETAAQNKQGTRNAWSAGDMPGAAKHFDANFTDYPGLYQAIVTSRHNRWTKTLAAMLAKSDKPVFVVVGAPHLFGPHNLLDHLRKAGYHVSQLVGYAKTSIAANQNTNGTLINKETVSIPSDLDNIKKDVELYHITYVSDGLKIKGYLATPKKGGTYPVIIFNRGGNKNFGSINDHRAASLLGRMAKWGYVVIASNYRGGGGSQGEDQFGGKDVDDILNLIPLLGKLPMADTSRMGIMGWSRGSMMTYEVMRRTCAFDAAVTGGNLTDLFGEIKARPKMEGVFKKLIPNYKQNKKSELEKRSAIEWAGKMCKNTPLMMLQGSADWRVPSSQSLAMVKKLYELKRPVRFHFYEGGDHGLTEYRQQYYADIRNFFDYYVKDAKNGPSLKPHGS